MQLHTFIYIILNLLLINLIGVDSPLLHTILNVICISGVLTLGLAHGAIDNILATTSEKVDNFRFIVKYLCIALAFVFSWYIFPNFTFLLFLLVSGYHFGQSQFVDWKIPSEIQSRSLYLLWGCIVLLLSFMLNKSELMAFGATNLPSISLFLFLVEYANYLLLLFVPILGLFYAYLCTSKTVRLQAVLKEVYLMGLISISFYLFNTVIGFSLFFLFIHSLKVINQEFVFCKRELSISGLFSFIKLFFPLTIASIFGIGLVSFLTYYLGYAEFIPMVLMVMLSSFTIPHSFVMNRFYSVVKIA